MSRPTRDHYAQAANDLDDLVSRYESRNNPNGYDHIAALLHLLAWQDHEQQKAQEHAVYGPGGDRSPEGGGTISRGTPGRTGLGRPTESRLDWGTDTRPRLRPELNDPYYRAQRKLRAGWNTEAAQMVDRWRQQATETGRWPHRTQDTA